MEYRELRNKVLYPQPIKEMSEYNVTFSTTESMSKCQGGDFVLEEKIKEQKGIAPKGIVNSKAWQKISRSIDKVEHVIDNVKKNLGISNVNSERNILLENEIMEWRAVLRLSSFILNSKCDFIQNIYGEKLIDDLISLTRNLKNKREEYFTAALSIPLENINYENLHVFSPDDTDDLLYQISNDSDDES